MRISQRLKPGIRSLSVSDAILAGHINADWLQTTQRCEAAASSMCEKKHCMYDLHASWYLCFSGPQAGEHTAATDPTFGRIRLIN